MTLDDLTAGAAVFIEVGNDADFDRVAGITTVGPV